MFEAQDVERSLQREVDSVVWKRGAQYYARGAVGACTFEAKDNVKGGTKSSDDVRMTISAEVYGSETYSTEITVHTGTGEVETAQCDCPYAQTNEEYCKHIAALGIVFVARLRMVFGEQRIGASASEIAKALQTGQSKIAIGTRGVHAGISEMEESAPAPVQSFGERYVGIVRTGYNGAQLQLHDTRRGSMPLVVSRGDLRLFLATTVTPINHHERALVEYLSKYDPWQQSFDAYHAFTLAQDAQVRLYLGSFNESKRMQFVAHEIPLDIAITLDHETADAYIPKKITSRVRSRFECSAHATAFRTDALSICAQGFVYVRKQEISLMPASSDTCSIIKRLAQGGLYYSPVDSDSVTTLSDKETIHINEIIADMRRCFELTSTLTPDFVVTEYDNPQQAFLIDYDASASTFSIRGAVDYGCDALDVAEEWHVTGYGAYLSLARRTDVRAHPLIVSIKGKTVGYASTDLKKEKDVCQRLFDKYGFGKRCALSLNGTKPIERFLHEHWESLMKLGWKMIFTHDEIRYVTSEVRSDMNVDLDAERDWLAFDLTLYCGEERVRLEDVIAFIERGDECLRTIDGRLIRVTNRADLERLVRMLERFSKNTEGKFEGRLYNAPEVADVASNSPHYRTQFAKSFDTFMHEAKSGRPVRKVKLPKAHQELLRPYQISGVEWMHFLRRYRFGGILADEMGLGKTIQALSHISIHSEDGVSSLVVCPKTLLHNWAREAQMRFPEISVAVIEGSASERKRMILQTKDVPHLFVTSYPLVQRDIEWYKAREKPFHYLLLDEAQSIKNPRTKNAHAVKAIPAEYRLALTGTPLENSVEELWSVFDFLMPGFLGHHATFQKHFGKPIMEEGSKEALAHLKLKTSCFMLRRTKDEVLKELPPKIEQTLRVELNDDQNVLYQEVLARTRTELFTEVEKRGFKRAQIHILAALTKLRQICNHPSLVEPTGMYTSAKLDACLEVVRELKAEGRKVLIFSQFTKMLDIIAASLRKEHVAFSMLTGKTNKRQELVDSFNTDPDQTAFLISLKAGGTGLNLTSADAVVIFDPWWNPATENQAIDRTHRIGQKKTVNVYRLITTGTIEEKILALQSNKRALFDALVEENSDLFKKLTWDDVQDLFR